VLETVITDRKLTNQFLPYFSNKSILITGAGGYIAANLINSLKNINCTIIRLSRGDSLLPIHGKATVVNVTGNINEKKTFEQSLENVEIVFHLAAQTSVYAAERDPLADLEANVLPMLNLLEVCREQNRQPVIIFSGTATEVGMPEELPVNENCIDKPVTIYDIHKLLAESYLKHYCQLGIVQGTILRLANVYGPGPKSSSPDRSMINTMIRNALMGEELTIYGKGAFLRDYVYIEDVISALLKAVVYIKQLNGQHFLIGSGCGHTIADAINLIAERSALKTGQRALVRHIQPPPGLSVIESRNFVADTGNFARLTGWQAHYSLEQGLDKTLDSFLEHTD
jgi:nucleoside-diphosphate-sugar epimerase